MLFETGNGLSVCAGVLLLLVDQYLKEFLFRLLADLLVGRSDLFIWSYYWPAWPVLETNETGVFGRKFFKDSQRS